MPRSVVLLLPHLMLVCACATGTPMAATQTNPSSDVVAAPVTGTAAPAPVVAAPTVAEPAQTAATTDADGSAEPHVSPETPFVSGSLRADVIRDVVQSRVRDVRACYERGLSARPLAGRVSVRFIIPPDGTVRISMVSASTLEDDVTEKCIAAAMRSLVFPRPEGGGIVMVTYPFMLSVGSADEVSTP